MSQIGVIAKMASAGKKKKPKKGAPKREDDIPEHLKSFIDSIAMKEEGASDNKKIKKDRRKSEAVDLHNETKDEQKKFTQMEIMTLWNSFKVDFPDEAINKHQMKQLVQDIFPKCDSDIVIENLFKVFDHEQSGKVVPRELLMCFSMSMQGSVEEKLHWTFKLYDKDGSGEIDPDEMEDIFRKLCKIAEGIERDQKYLEKVKRDKEVERKMVEKEKEEIRKQQEAEDAMLGRSNKIVLLSERKQKLSSSNNSLFKSVGLATTKLSNGNKIQMKRKSAAEETITEQAKEEKADAPVKKNEVMDVIKDELMDPSRDCKKFDPGKRARELFDALDDDGNGVLTEDEFVQGCLSDEAFVQLLEDFNGDFIWGSG